MGANKQSANTHHASHDFFHVRESPLKESFDTCTSTRGIFSAFVTFYGLLCSVTLVTYLSKPEVFVSDLEFVQRAFSNFSIFIIQWFVLFFAVTFIAYPATKHHVMSSSHNSLLYRTCILLTVLIIAVIPVYAIHTFKFHTVLRIATVIEQLRHLMKLMAFLIECGKKKQNMADTNNNNSNSGTEAPTMHSFVYFMFAPTMVYRDHYPVARKPTDWNLAACYLAQFALSMYIALLLLKRVMEPKFEIIGLRPLTIDDMAAIFTSSLLCAMYFAFCISYAFLHCWQNMFAEMMNFGDRLFYKDWMSSKDLMDFLRTWNYLIHAWIVEYLYKPVLQATSSKPISVFVAMAMAGIIHDYMISICGEYFLLYETTFIPLMLLTTCYNEWMQSYNDKSVPEKKEKVIEETGQKRTTGTNISMFVVITLTNTLECIIIMGEYYSVRNCNKPESGWRSSFLVPQFLSCPSFDLR